MGIKRMPVVLQVFDELQEENAVGAHIVPREQRHSLEARDLGSAPATLADHDLSLAGAVRCGVAIIGWIMRFALIVAASSSRPSNRLRG
jgi:hypothetical protein